MVYLENPMNQPSASADIESLFQHPDTLIPYISNALYRYDQKTFAVQKPISDLARASAVLFLLGICYHGDGHPAPCLILTKRSAKVRQAGDLCCPGGGISLPKDLNWARLLYLPGSPLSRWPFIREWKKKHPHKYRDLALLLATSLRESYEEIRLNPLKVRFLGSLPAQHLGVFGREIYPVVGWSSQIKRFVLNWEVDQMVTIPLKNLLNPDKYARTRFNLDDIPENTDHLDWNDRPCFIHESMGESEILWGATYRITMIFLEIVFGFTSPPMTSLPLIESSLDKNYMSGSRRRM
jgi:hypothetical protein